MITKDGDETRLRTDRWHLNIRAVIVHDVPDLIESLREQPVHLSRYDSGVSRNHQIDLTVSVVLHQKRPIHTF